MHPINWKPKSRELRQFGLTILIGFGLIGLFLFFFLHQSLAGRICWAIAVGVCVFSLIWPPLSLPFYYLWMAIAVVVGSAVSTLVLSILYFGMFAPLGLLLRCMGKLSLHKLPDKTRTSYWEDYPPVQSKAFYERQYS